MTIFISYSRAHSDFALRLARDLKSAGFDIWLDQLNIPTGARWDDEIQKALDKCKTFLIILSPESVESQNVKDEIGYAIDAKKHILPVVIESCNVPFRLRRFQHVDFSNRPYGESLAEIKELLSHPAIDSGADDGGKASTPVKKTGSPHEPRGNWKSAGAQPKRKSVVPIAIGVLVCVALIVAIIFLYPIIAKLLNPTPVTTVPPIQVTTSVPPIDVTITATTAVPDPAIADMVLVPEGPFTMGNSAGDSKTGETDIHTVNLSAFYIGKYEVTNALYKLCVDEEYCQLPTNPDSRPIYYGDPKYAEYPVIYVNWNMAKAYCTWRGFRLPTEAEWEKAARGVDGRIYPWGEQINCSNANFKGCIGETSRVGNYESGKSPFGAYDMAGNVWEWVSDWYQEDYYSTLIGNALNPLGPDSGDTRVIRGGAYNNSEPSVRTTIRNSSDPFESSEVVGFRCATTAK